MESRVKMEMENKRDCATYSSFNMLSNLTHLMAIHAGCISTASM
jgi:hypothetical protein